MTKNEFIEITNKCFTEQGAKRCKRKYIYEASDMNIVFVLIRSYYSDCYYLDYNISIKALHPDFVLNDDNLDFILIPRLTLVNGVCQLVIEELEKSVYEETLRSTIKKFIEEINENGLYFIKKIESKGYVLEPKAHELISTLK